MKKLIQIELTKSLNYNPFRVVLILHFVFFLLGIFAIPRIEIKIPFLSIMPLYQFPHVWNFFTWIAGYYNITLVLLVIMMTCLEFNHKTFKQQILFGLSRMDLFKQKVILIFFISLYVAALLFVTSLISGLTYSYRISFSIAFDRSIIILISFLQTFAFMSLGLLFALIFKNTILSVLGFGFYRVFLEPIARTMANPEARWFFPTKFITNLTPRPDVVELVKQKIQSADSASPEELADFNQFVSQKVPLWQNIILTLVFILLVLGLSYYILRKRRLS
jgi:hypothetical protein